jgi:hypothetical protein
MLAIGAGAMALALGAMAGLLLPAQQTDLGVISAPGPRVVIAVDARATPSRMVALDASEAPYMARPRHPATPRPAPATTAAPEHPAPADTVVVASLPPAALPTGPAPMPEQVQIVVQDGPPPVIPPRRPATRTEAVELAGDAPRARSPIPPPRPETVARLAATLAPLAPLPARLETTPPPEGAGQARPDPLAGALAGSLRSAHSCGSSLTRAIPRRPGSAPGGQAQLARIEASGRNRDSAVVEAALAGNVPDFLRQLVPVTMTGTGSDGRRLEITLCVMPDYLALGHDRDFVRVPLGLPAARRIAEAFAMVLPTAQMVDAIHAQARHRLSPQPMTPGPQMASTDYLLRHNATLEAQRARAGAPLGALISGHKKDVVLTNRLAQVQRRVAIYGWHQANGRPIQPLSTVHGEGYADYSHGIRLISRTAYVNGRAVDLMDLLTDSRTASVLNAEGPLRATLALAALR